MRSARSFLGPFISHRLSLVVMLTACIGCSPRDETPSPSPDASLEDLLGKITFSPTSTSERFTPRYYVVTEKGEPSPLLDGVGFFFLRRHVAQTLQGARTFVVVRDRKANVGRWVSGIFL